MLCLLNQSSVVDCGTCSAILCCGCFPLEVMLKTVLFVYSFVNMLRRWSMSCVKVSCSSGFCSSTCVLRSRSWYFLSYPLLCCSMKLNLLVMTYNVVTWKQLRKDGWLYRFIRQSAMVFMPRASSGCVFLMKYVLSFTLWNFGMVISLSLCLVSSLRMLS